MKRILIAGPAGGFPNYKDALTACGALPIESLADVCAQDYDGLLLPGGADIDPSFYGQVNRCSAGVDRALDTAQFAALDRFVKAGKPVLGICRGHQLIHVYFGGSLIQEIPAYPRHAAKNRIDKVHPTTAAPGSFLADLYGTHFSTNSSHHQAVGRLGTGMRAVQWSEHGTVLEGSLHESFPIFSVQWHPERMAFAHRRPDTVDGALLFRFFLAQCPEVRP